MTIVSPGFIVGHYENHICIMTSCALVKTVTRFGAILFRMLLLDRMCTIPCREA